ncbi:MAG: hypothetical protein Q8O25_02225 [Sulfurisoma sp.]|nr:hypothetical protein [Sulfurisoma sp.]
MTTFRTLPRKTLPSAAGPRRQEGIVLFIALIALVVLSLAGIGFMRSVDTASVLAGNLAFNRASVAISDSGMEEARVQLATLDNAITSGRCSLTAPASCLWMNGSDMTAGRAPTGGTPPANGYFAWADPTFNYRTFNWGNATNSDNMTYQFNAAVASWTAAQAAALIGYDIRYVIHRMCEFPWSSTDATKGDPASSNCMTTASTGGQSQGSITVSSNQTQTAASVPLYRITIRVMGPRNSVAYVQVWSS